MRSGHLFSGLTLVVSAAAALVVLHGCQDTPEPAEPDLAVTAVQKTLTVVGSGSGSGVVTSIPAGINCRITAGVAATTGCKVQFNQGTVVTLTPVPDSGHSFLKWFGSCSGTGNCQVTMSADRSTTARFLKGPFAVRISNATPGVGSGTVRTQSGLTPAIDCVISDGTIAKFGCVGKYPAYTQLTFTATPAPGFVFTGWGAPCSGTGTCNYTAVQGKIISAGFAPVGSPTAAGDGKWTSVFPTPVVAVHMGLLPTGKVIFWGDRGPSQLWDPVNPGAGFVPATKPYRIFCSGHTLLPDGRLFVAGGHITNNHGLPLGAIFDPSLNTWSTTATPMAQGRWYPTATTLPDGELLVVAGADENAVTVTIPEIWSGSGWRRLTGADMALPYYPSMFVAPNGKVFFAGSTKTTRYLSVDGTGEWTTVADRIVPNRSYGSAVMYAPGKILYAGGGDPPTSSAEVIDLNEAAPAWRAVAGMAYARRQMLATILADGKVLVMQGTSGAGFNDVTSPVYYAELWDPSSESWRTLAPESKIRTYHSTALLLPDGRVLSSGSGEGGGVPYVSSQLSAQIFSPPYLFNSDGSPAARPTITSAPSNISYGQTIDVETPDAGSVTRGNLIRLSSVTHTVNASQLIYPLTFTTDDPASTTLHATAPASGNLAPPGPYMLFLINAAGVPSVAKMVTVGP